MRGMITVQAGRAYELRTERVGRAYELRTERVGRAYKLRELGELRGLDMICFWGSRQLPHCRLGPAGNYHIVNLGSPMLAIRIFL